MHIGCLISGALQAGIFRVFACAKGLQAVCATNMFALCTLWERDSYGCSTKSLLMFAWGGALGKHPRHAFIIAEMRAQKQLLALAKAVGIMSYRWKVWHAAGQSFFSNGYHVVTHVLS